MVNPSNVFFFFKTIALIKSLVNIHMHVPGEFEFALFHVFFNYSYLTIC